MDRFEQTQIKEFFQTLMSRPLSRIVTRINDEKHIFPSFSTIQEKIDSNAYLTIMDFAIDVRTVFERARFADSGNEISDIAIIQLETWFEKHLLKVPRNKEEALFNQLAKLKKNLNLFRRAMSMTAAKPKPQTEIRIAEEERKIPPASLINEVQQLIKDEMTTVETQMKVAAMIRKYLPKFDPTPTVRINASTISYELAEELKEYLLKVKKDRLAAKD
ncbi:hypothetical protein TRFO_00882 [Tritrichomonas foetus]|uniref:Uncharacterized protein n=1 Tax=Tritrichomonas foetus TaxID=1144522 RepID=A0A1J4L279_9EUKA|nr:hypothetical protein TRFO_00882 [Tritrichomonas foetus]|eukprot:OHT17617.1 hypothetical protein TRFO_00882 [Tritrichomonas foetus]